MFSCIFILCSPVFVSAVFVHLCLVFFRAYFETLVVEAGGERLESRDQVHLCVLCICIWCFHVFVSDVFVNLYQVLFLQTYTVDFGCGGWSLMTRTRLMAASDASVWK